MVIFKVMLNFQCALFVFKLTGNNIIDNTIPLEICKSVSTLKFKLPLRVVAKIFSR